MCGRIPTNRFGAISGIRRPDIPVLSVLLACGTSCEAAMGVTWAYLGWAHRRAGWIRVGVKLEAFAMAAAAVASDHKATIVHRRSPTIAARYRLST